MTCSTSSSPSTIGSSSPVRRGTIFSGSRCRPPPAPESTSSRPRPTGSSGTSSTSPPTTTSGSRTGPKSSRQSIEATKKYGTGASGSPILSGTIDLHEELVSKLAAFKRKEDALLFPSGYAANLGVISGLMRPGDLVVTDQYAHASIVDGIILSKAEVRYFRHNSVPDLDRKLKGFTGKKLVIVEGVYSMDGDLARLPEIVEVSKRHGARIMIDEAHSTFLFGKNGRGITEHFGHGGRGRHPLRDVFEDARRHRRIRRRIAVAHPLPQGVRPLARVLLRASAGSGRRTPQGPRDRPETSRSSGRGSGRTSPTCRTFFARGARHRRLAVAGHPHHGARRRENLPDRREAHPRGSVSQPRPLSGRRQTPVAFSHFDHGGPFESRISPKPPRSSGACSRATDYATDEVPFRERGQRVLRDAAG